MRYTHIIIPDGPYIDPKGRRCLVVHEHTPGVEPGLGTHVIGGVTSAARPNTRQRLPNPWLEAQSEFDYAIDANLKPARRTISNSFKRAVKAIKHKAVQLDANNAATAPRITR